MLHISLCYRTPSPNSSKGLLVKSFNSISSHKTFGAKANSAVQGICCVASIVLVSCCCMKFPLLDSVLAVDDNQFYDRFEKSTENESKLRYDTFVLILQTTTAYE